MAEDTFQYSLLEADNPAELVEGICDLVKDGWSLQGGICVWFEPGVPATPPHTSPGIVHYAQALVRTL